MERLTERNVKLCEIRNMPHETFYYKLQEYENFMEKHEIQDLKYLESILCDLLTLERDKIAYQLENETLNDRWEKLKQWCEEHCYYVEECCGDINTDDYREYVDKYINIAELLDKMQELEMDKKI